MKRKEFLDIIEASFPAHFKSIEKDQIRLWCKTAIVVGVGSFGHPGAIQCPLSGSGVKIYGRMPTERHMDFARMFDRNIYKAEGCVDSIRIED